MQYVRPVDFNAFKPTEFHSQRIADRSSGLDSCVLILTRVPPGTGTTAGLHVHYGDQLYYILSGRMNVQLGKEKLTAGPKDLVVIPRGMPHWNWNTSDQDEVHFEFICPPPPGNEAASTPVDESAPIPDVKGLQLIRGLDESKFDLSRFSQVVMADRASGVDSVSLGVFRVPVGGRSPELHVHRFDQIYYTISGTMGIQIGLEEYTVPANSYVIIPAGMPHMNWNAGQDVQYFINARTPEPADRSKVWDILVTFGEEGPRPA